MHPFVVMTSVIIIALGSTRRQSSMSFNNRRYVKAVRRRPAAILTTTTEADEPPVIVTPSPRITVSTDFDEEDEQPLQQNRQEHCSNRWNYFRDQLIKPLLLQKFPSIMFGQIQTLTAKYYDNVSNDSKRRLRDLLDSGHSPKSFNEFIHDETLLKAKDKKKALGEVIHDIFKSDAGKELQKQW